MGAIASTLVYRLGLILLIGSSMLLASCAGGRKAVMVGGTRCVVTTKKAPFFKNGPAQGSSDLDLKKGERVTLVSTKLGYCYVKTEGGGLGYIADDQLAPAPPEPLKPSPQIAAVNPAMPYGGFEHISAPPLFGLPDSLEGSEMIGPVQPGENELLPPLPEPSSSRQ